MNPSCFIIESTGTSSTNTSELAAMEVQSKRLDQESWEPGGHEKGEAEDREPAPVYLIGSTELFTQALRKGKAGACGAALTTTKIGCPSFSRASRVSMAVRKTGTEGKMAQRVKCLSCQHEGLN